MNTLLSQEVDLLQAMYSEDELNVIGYDQETNTFQSPTIIQLEVSPNTGLDNTNQYVRIQLQLLIENPNDFPQQLFHQKQEFLSVQTRRGLHDSQCDKLMSQLRNCCLIILQIRNLRDKVSESAIEEMYNNPLFMTLVQTARDFLDSENESVVHINDCPICLEQLQDNVVRLDCFHVYHSYCLFTWFKVVTCEWYEQQLLKQETDYRGRESKYGESTNTILKRIAANYSCPICKISVPDETVQDVVRLDIQRTLADYQQSRDKQYFELLKQQLAEQRRIEEEKQKLQEEEEEKERKRREKKLRRLKSLQKDKKLEITPGCILHTIQIRGIVYNNKTGTKILNELFEPYKVAKHNVNEIYTEDGTKR
jgi:hypothetical protein